MKVLSGAYIPDEGEILIEGKNAHMTDPLDARRLGIEMVYQDLAIANNLDVTANVFLGREAVSAHLGPFSVMDSRRMEQEAQRLLNRLKIAILRAPDGGEVVGQQRQAVIARATAFNPEVIIGRAYGTLSVAQARCF
jgi:ABC-type sugar transport system ATPase subunit